MDKPTNVPLERTQPAADDLISYQDLAFKLEGMRGNPRVLVTSPGRSHEGRDVFLATISSPENIKSLHAIRTKILEASAFQRKRKTLSEAISPPPISDDLLGDT